MLYNNFELTADNHLQYYFNNDSLLHWRTSPYQSSHMRIKISPTDCNFLSSLGNTAKKLANNPYGKLTLLLSGGLDSEIACRIFHQHRCDFNVAIIKFTNELNIDDYHGAVELCQKLDISPNIIIFDPVDFFENGDWIRIGNEYQSYTFCQQILLHIANKIAEPLLTVDEIALSKQNTSWYFVKNEDQDGCWHRFVDATGIPAYSNFYTYDSSTIWTFMQSRTVKELIHNKIFGKLGWISSKNQIYQDLTGWQLKVRKKRTGMENLMHIWHVVENEMAVQLHDRSATFAFDAIDISNSTRETHLTCNQT